MDLSCDCCGKYLGEMSKGKLHKKRKMVILCEECMNKYKTFESLANYNKETKKSNYEMHDFMKDIMKGKI